MRCQKCWEEFKEKDIHESHDIPKYLGGNDIMGRHHLCKECHEKYEMEVLKVVFINYIQTLPEEIKNQMRGWARMVRGWFFRK